MIKCPLCELVGIPFYVQDEEQLRQHQAEMHVCVQEEAVKTITENILPPPEDIKVETNNALAIDLRIKMMEYMIKSLTKEVNELKQLRGIEP